MEADVKSLERIRHYRFYWDWAWSVAPVLGLIWLCEHVSFYFYPLAAVLIGNRFFRLATLGHEGLHNLISTNSWWNSFLARYFCHYPTFVSHARYKSIHALHHRFLGEPRDPDMYIYKEFPEPFSVWLKRIIRDLLTLRIIYEFFEYYSEIPERLRRLLGMNPTKLVLFKSDFWSYAVFWTLALSAVHHFGFWQEFLIYWVIPAYLHFPLIQLANGLQHGAFSKTVDTRTITAPLGLMTFVIPLDLNYHYEHHLNPRIPHYNLRAFSKMLKVKEEGRDAQRTPVLKAFRLLFSPPPNT